MPKKRRPYYSREHVEILRDIVPLETVVHMTNTALSYAGPHRLKGLCPFHGEKTLSFFVLQKLDRYYCFGCGMEGDVFKFLMDKFGLNFVQAVDMIEVMAGRPERTSSTFVTLSAASESILQELERVMAEKK